MNNTGTQFQVKKDFIIEAAKKRIAYVDTYRKKYRENKITELMNRKTWSWLKWNYEKPLTREEAEKLVDAPATTMWEIHHHWTNQLSSSFAYTMIRLCRITEEDYVLLGTEDADAVESWSKN